MELSDLLPAVDPTASLVQRFVLAFLAFELALDLLAKHLNVRSASSKPPKALNDVFEADEYAKSQAYLRARTSFGNVSTLYNTALFLAAWWLGLYNQFDVDVVRALSLPEGLEWMLRGCIFFFGISFITTLLNIPFSIYSTFVLEERFGFNKTTWKTFLLDFVKEQVLTVVVGVPVMAVVLWFFESFGSTAWVWTWAFLMVFILCAQVIVPLYIMPLFNKFDPLPEGETKDRISLLTSQLDFALSGVYIMDGSTRSSHSNAFFAGFGKGRRLVLFDTLVEQLSVDEIISVLGHEIGHMKLWHIHVRMTTEMAKMGLMLYCLNLFISSPALFDAFFVTSPSIYVGMFLFSSVYSPLEFVLGIASTAVTRYHEYEADRFSADQLGKGECLISGLKKLAKKNLSNLSPHWLVVFLTFSHPPLADRVAAIRAAGAAKGAKKRN